MANGTTVGSLTLASTFDCISVRASFTGDDNANNSAAIQFRVTGSGTWRNAYTTIVDRRPTISGSANPYVNQARGSIVGLVAGTSYDVQVTFSDADGVTGSVLSGSVSTIASTPPLGGTTWYVDDVVPNGDGSSGSPFNSIANGIAAASAGDTVYIRAGTYPAFTLSKSGTSGAWLALVGEDRDTTIIQGGTTGLTINANYVQVKDLRLQKPTTSGTTQGIVVLVGASQHHVWIDNLHLEDLPLPAGGSSYGNASVALSNSVHHVYVLNSLFHAPSLSSRADGDYDLGGFGVQIGSLTDEGTLIVKGNTFDGKFQDAIGGTPESFGYYQWNNSDVANNTISGYSDDGIQCEGDDVNTRIWGNVITCNHGNSTIATQSSFAGPVYVFRNVLTNTREGTIFKVGSGVYTQLFHNTCDSSGSYANVLSGTLTNWTVKNNIFKGSNYSILEYIGATNALNYNLYHPNTSIAYLWGGTTNYETVAALYAGTGQEVTRYTGDPLFLNAAKQIDDTSPAYNAGVALSNFNDATSAWPSSGTNPDLGYYEVGGSTIPRPPSNVVVR